VNQYNNPWLTAAQAAAVLGVTRATLYAYVSRGHVRSQAASGRSRTRRYSRDDIERLRRRAEERRDPDKAAERALHWGLPVLESSITLVDGERVYYRGHNAVALADTRPLAEVASLLWTGAFDAPGTHAPAAIRNRKDDKSLPFVARAQRALIEAAARDASAFDTRPSTVCANGWRMLSLLTVVATGDVESASTVDEALARAWGVATQADLLRRVLILCADHELNVSTMTVRAVASAGSTPYGAVTAGLAALEGPRHGGAAARVEAMLAAIRPARDLEAAIGARIRRGEALDGFGHPLYPKGDPRAAAIMRWLSEARPRSAEVRFVGRVARAASSTIREQPNLDFALAAVARALRLPAGAPLVLFAIGRTLGWIAHALEQYATGQLIRRRARYVGAAPAPQQIHP
jgi:citrate synthase